jgi:hypothetical protein
MALDGFLGLSVHVPGDRIVQIIFTAVIAYVRRSVLDENAGLAALEHYRDLSGLRFS